HKLSSRVLCTLDTHFPLCVSFFFFQFPGHHRYLHSFPTRRSSDLVFVQLPETEHAAFVLIPRDGADPIQSPRLATVSRVSVTEGQTVAAGAELFVMRSDEIRAFDTQLQTLTEDLHTQEMTLAKMDEAYAAEANIKNAQVSQAEGELRFREK